MPGIGDTALWPEVVEYAVQGQFCGGGLSGAL